MDLVGPLLLGAVVLSFVNLVRQLRARDWNGALTQVCAYAVGVAALFLVGATVWAQQQVVFEQPLSDLNGWDKVVAGILVGTVGTTIAELKKAFDNNDTASKPPLLPPDSDG